MLSRSVPDYLALQLLVGIQTTESIAAAGAQLGLTQQAASLRVRAVEKQVGVPLVLRGPRGSSLTEAGALVAQWAAGLLGAAEQLETGIAALRQERQAHLRVAASLTIAEHYVPQWFLALRGEEERLGQPLTDIELLTRNSTAVTSAVSSGKVDLGFIENPDVPRSVRSAIVAADRLVVVVDPRHPWVRRRRPVTPSDLAATPLVLREPGSGTREALVRALSSALPNGPSMVPPSLEVAGTAAVRAAIAAGAGPGALSVLTVADDLALGRLVEIRVPGLDLRRDLRAVWRDGGSPPAGPARALVAVAVAQGRAARDVHS